jgi:hypothetical protein
LVCTTTETVQEYAHLSHPPPTPGTLNNLSQSHRQTSAHSQSWPQQPLIPTPSALEGGGGGSVGAGPSPDLRRLKPAVSELPSGVVQSIQLTVPSNTDYLAPSVSPHQISGLALSSAKRRVSTVDPLGAQHRQVDFLARHVTENQPAPSAYPTYPEWSDSSPAILTAQYPATVPADMVQYPSSLTHRRESVISLHSEDSFQFPSSSGLPDDLDSNAAFSPRYASPGAPSHFAGHTFPRQGTSSAARRTGIRKRAAEPKDPRAAKRLQNQRESDELNMEEMYRLFVPESVGKVPKKDRCATSTS